MQFIVDDIWNLRVLSMTLRYAPQATDEPYIYRQTRPNEFSLHDGVCNTRHCRTFNYLLRPADGVYFVELTSL